MSTPNPETADTSLRIVELTAENIKRLTAITIRADGKSVRLEGGNGAGKTSVLDSIAYALGGKSLIPDKPIRNGQKSGRVRVDLGELIVERRFTASGSTLAVMSKDGAKYPSPQAILDKLVGDLSFDPLAFVTMKPDEQLETLKKVVGVSFDDLEVQHSEAFEERKVINREVKQLEGELAGLPPTHAETPEEPVSVDALLTELRQAEDHNKRVEAVGRNLYDARRGMQTIELEIDQVNSQIADLQRQFEALAKRKEELRAALQAREELVAQRETEAAELKLQDTAPILSSIQQVETVNQKVRENQRRQELAKLIQAKSEEADNITERLEAIELEKQARLATAKFPVPALSFSESGVLLNDLPFKQASAAEQLRVSVGMGMAMNPRLKVLLIRDGSLLDDDNLALLSHMAAEHGAQVWLERVASGKEVSVVIEDGEAA